MKKNLETLYELQEIDLKLDGIAGARNSLLTEIDALDQKVAEAHQEMLAKDEVLAALEADKVQLEATLAAEAENITRSEARLKEIKTQKEYLAVSKEITAARKMRTELEEQLLQKITQSDELKVAIAESRSKLEALEKNIGAQKSEVQQKVDELESSIAADQSAREEKINVLPQSVVKRYGRLREMRRGLAVVEARDGSCLGCNINLPPQLYNTLFRGDELITCPHCQRMVVFRQQPQVNNK
ncbi:zinc ribbon domain-containing protein [Geobacter sp. OR-1]|uniref:zinc ribbon domain-containing protein n=1 Tax=Geobacter sp. OR-1 TaxID=1266765 RepID=UPI0005AA086D|nr:C4-type zinc ribbon domain-containing protein [Geobacter sp. OR-1]